jgi:hypothetical protein
MIACQDAPPELPHTNGSWRSPSYLGTYSLGRIIDCRISDGILSQGKKIKIKTGRA